MNRSLLFLRLFFLVISTFFITTVIASAHSGPPLQGLLIGGGVGLAFGLVLIAFDRLFKRFHLRSFNIAILGLAFGYLMGKALVLVFQTVMDLSQIQVALQPQTIELIRTALFLFGLYLGAIMTLRSADEIHLSIPFIKLSRSTQKKRDLLLDGWVLADSRILDVAATGLFDHQLVAARFLVKDLSFQAEMEDEAVRNKAKRSLETLKKLEALPGLELRYNDTDFPEVKESFAKLLKLARLLDANLLTADPARIQTTQVETVKIINIHSLSSALKPLMQAGQAIRVKIQHFGKGPNQGVGYLEDGTMVVVNGGGDYIDEVVETQVLSVKHTSSGRMIFCNARD
jgi:uncharacterized protein YacL